MNNEIANTRKLIKALDDSRLFCGDVSSATVRPWLKHLLEQIAQTHQSIADALCAHIATDDVASRDGFPWQACRMAWAHWIARFSFDIELAYLQQAKQREDRLARRFGRAAQRTRDRDIRGCLQLRLCEIEHMRMKITRLITLMQAGSSSPSPEWDVRAPAIAPVVSERSAARSSGRIQARRLWEE